MPPAPAARRRRVTSGTPKTTAAERPLTAANTVAVAAVEEATMTTVSIASPVAAIVSSRSQAPPLGVVSLPGSSVNIGRSMIHHPLVCLVDRPLARVGGPSWSIAVVRERGAEGRTGCPRGQPVRPPSAGPERRQGTHRPRRPPHPAAQPPAQGRQQPPVETVAPARR